MLLRATLAAAALAAAASLAPAPDPAPGPEGIPSAAAALPPATYAWPVEGPVIRPFEEPTGPFGPGHRGIDIASPPGTLVRAPERGTVAFAGAVAGSLFVSIDHPGGVRTTSSWLSSIAVRAGDEVVRGAPVGAVGGGHPGVEPPHLHLGARVGGVHVDPMLLLERRSVVGLVRLAPLEEAPE